MSQAYPGERLYGFLSTYDKGIHENQEGEILQDDFLWRKGCHSPLQRNRERVPKEGRKLHPWAYEQTANYSVPIVYQDKEGKHHEIGSLEFELIDLNEYSSPQGEPYPPISKLGLIFILHPEWMRESGISKEFTEHTMLQLMQKMNDIVPGLIDQQPHPSQFPFAVDYLRYRQPPLLLSD